jgi:pimeloyl-ACP methyl ester carboxylesterase
MMRTRRASTVGVAMAILGVTAVVAPASAQPPLDDGDATGKGPLGGLSVAPPTLARLDARAPADVTLGGAGLIADAAVELVPCDEEPSFLCGTVQVPLDRRNPDDRTLGIAFAIVPHNGPQEVADGAIFVTCGGPGCSGTAIATFGFSFIFGDLLETMDVVYVDQRGVGLSEVIDCPELQSAGPLYESAAACHDQLGDTANLYSTSDVADDLDDVRAALGYEQIDVFGGSYAGVDMITYAVRHTEHVRSVVLASPAMVVGTDPFYPYAPEAMPGIAAGMCGRSPACAAEHRDAERDFAQAARQLRRRPVSGVGIDSAGFEHDMTVDENLLRTSPVPVRCCRLPQRRAVETTCRCCDSPRTRIRPTSPVMTSASSRSGTTWRDRASMALCRSTRALRPMSARRSSLPPTRRSLTSTESSARRRGRHPVISGSSHRRASCRRGRTVRCTQTGRRWSVCRR